jgi:hypothetical protein
MVIPSRRIPGGQELRQGAQSSRFPSQARRLFFVCFYIRPPYRRRQRLGQLLLQGSEFIAAPALQRMLLFPVVVTLFIDQAMSVALLRLPDGTRA